MTLDYDTYSQIILGTVTKENTLLILPPNYSTKRITRILMDYFSTSKPNQKIAVLYPDIKKREIVESNGVQSPNGPKISLVNSTSVKVRQDQYSSSDVFIMTPHLLRNDIFRQIVSLKDFSLIIVEEAHLAKGKHAIVKLFEIFHQNKLFVRTVGYTSFFFKDFQEIDEVCKNLLITKIEFGKEKSFILTSLETNFNEKIITIPINKSMYNFCSELNRYIREYQSFLKKRGVNKPLTVRREFPDFIMHVRKEYNHDQQRILIRKAVELINFQTLKELVEASGINAAIKYLENLEMKNSETKGDEKVSNIHSSFVRTPIFRELLLELKTISKDTDHPKFHRLVQLMNELKEKNQLSSFFIIVNNKTVIKNLSTFLKNSGLDNVILQKNQTKERENTLSKFLKGEIRVLLSTKLIELEADAIIFFNNPVKYSDYLERRNKDSDVYILLTHRSNEERVFHKFRNREKIVGKILEDSRLKQRLIRNQQIIFKKRINEQMDSRTKAMVDVVRVLQKGRNNQVKSEE
jgi:ERCC4-related helicase